MDSSLFLLLALGLALNAVLVNTMPKTESTGILVASALKEPQRRDFQKTAAVQNRSSLMSNLAESVKYSNGHPKYISPQTATKFDIDLDIVFSEETKPDVEKSAIQCLAKFLGINENEVKISSYHTSPGNGGAHYYFYQVFPYQDRSLRIVNAAASMNVVDGIVRSVGNTFYRKDRTRDVNIKQKTAAADAILAFAEILKLQINQADEKIFQESQENEFEGLSFTNAKISAVLAYMQDLRDIFLVWEFEVDMNANQVRHATYTAYPIDRAVDPGMDEKVEFSDPMNKASSPQGWHQINNDLCMGSWGNNVVAQGNHDGKADSVVEKRTMGTGGLNFSAPFDPTAEDPALFDDAAITNLFYVTNMMHDIFYTYGFDEAAGNFQKYNFDQNFKDGENDPLIADAQYGAKAGEMNNSYFSTPVDGVSPRMRVLLFNERADGRLRDSTFDNSVIIHEYLHGISERLTAGRMQVGFLNIGESLGLSEGWSDVFSVVLRTTKHSTRNTKFLIGDYVVEGGLRKNPYCADQEVNSSMYGHVLDDNKNFKKRYSMGEIWASILLEVYWDLRDFYGLASVENTHNIDWYMPPPGVDVRYSKEMKGNQLFVHLVIQGMKIQPPNPNFIQARDAILEADKTVYDGIHLDVLWEAFARRSLGYDAEYPGKPGYKLPDISPHNIQYIKPNARIPLHRSKFKTFV